MSEAVRTSKQQQISVTLMFIWRSKLVERWSNAVVLRQRNSAIQTTIPARPRAATTRPVDLSLPPCLKDCALADRPTAFVADDAPVAYIGTGVRLQ